MSSRWDEPVLRWLLRPLADDSFLPIYLGNTLDNGENVAMPRGTLTREVEHAFWSLTPDSEHPARDRGAAWTKLKQILDKLSDLDDMVDAVVPFFSRLVGRVGRILKQARRYHLARFWAWPELATEVRPPLQLSEYYETHAHFRGSVPFDHLWSTMMEDARARAILRRDTCTVRPWVHTRAELVAYAAGLRTVLAGAATSEDELRRMLTEDIGDIQKVQYLALYANLRRFLLHQRGHTGLVRFSQGYKRFTKVAKGWKARDGDRKAVTAICKRFERSGAIAVELRPTLEPNRIELQRKLREIVLGYFAYLGDPTTERPLAMGLVLSLYKQEVTEQASQRHGRSKDHALHRRLEEQAKVWARQIDALLAVVEAVPALRMFIVGVDAAGLEQGSPVRALAPVFDKLHEYHHNWNLERSRQGRVIDVDDLQRRIRERGKPGLAPSDHALALWEQLNQDDDAIPHHRLGLTVHAGEDFADPTTGLREIWEAVELLGLTFGDRIGHAIALSLDAKRLLTLLERRADAKETPWVRHGEHNPRAPMRLRKPIGVHVLDSAWSDRALGPTRSHGQNAALSAELTRAIGALPPHEAVLESLKNSAFPSTILLPGVCFIDHDALEPEMCCWIELEEEWFDRFERLRQAVISKLHVVGIVVESCPTSNCAVANLDEPPLFGLLEISPPLRCTLATDDPGILDAWPEHEIARSPRADQKSRILDENKQASFVQRTR